MKTKLLTTAIACALLISITGCAADNTAQMLHDNAEVTVNTEAVTEPSADTQTVTLTAETAEKEMPAQPASTEAPQTSEAPETDPTRESEPPKQTEPPKVTEPPESKPDETPKSVDSTPTETAKPESAGPQFDINYWLEFARKYAESIGLAIDPEAVSCWDNPIIAGPNSKYLERDIKTRMNRYKNVEGFTDIWVWAEPDGSGNYRLFIGYA